MPLLEFYSAALNGGGKSQFSLQNEIKNNNN